ncbi:uncharacterized protein LOC124262094 isoform X1 [Haliotis rubra]|uniref:uncharacterized protein LOC124262094 isoform X1 n=1 Tax=Haliotis rubra TaxID=36100 RepID=UPI001EE57B45|nr:uncharacterized protein LOC124262094 isoform X1 [Haliotis rubra]
MFCQFITQVTAGGCGDKMDCITLICTYFSLGLTNNEILCFLAQDHKMIISNRTLKRCLSKCKLFRRKQCTDIQQVVLYILNECDSSGRQHGYRWMHRMCQEKGYVVDKETVRCLLPIIDTDGVNCRKKRALVHRTYISSGPNSVRHMDGYDKLKPYGICIHGCIDGFSRYVIWLEAWVTNNDPKVITGYYTEAVRRLNGCPERVRSDLGSQHTDRFSGNKSFLCGSSHTNQRIESWWCILRKQWAQFWMDLFKQITDDGYFAGDFIDKNLVQFCFSAMYTG